MYPTLVLACFLPLLVFAQTTATGRNSPTLIPLTLSVTPTSTGTTSVNVTASTTSSAAFPNLSGYSSCVLESDDPETCVHLSNFTVTTCFGLATSKANCTSEVEVNCYCTSKAFPAAIVACMATNCPTELVSAETLAQLFCNLASTSTALSFPLSASTSSLLLTSNTAPTPSPTSNSTSSVGTSTTRTIITSATATGSAKRINTGTMVGVWLVAGVLCL